MITGAHAIIYSGEAEVDRTFIRDVLGLPSVDVGDGWLIFGLPPSEVAVHPAEESGRHELFLLVADVARMNRTSDDLPAGIVTANSCSTAMTARSSPGIRGEP